MQHLGAATFALAVGLLVATPALEDRVLQYGALGLSALMVWLGYKLLIKALKHLDDHHQRCHDWGSSREERLIQGLHDSGENLASITKQVLEEMRRITR